MRPMPGTSAGSPVVTTPPAATARAAAASTSPHAMQGVQCVSRPAFTALAPPITTPRCVIDFPIGLSAKVHPKTAP